MLIQHNRTFTYSCKYGYHVRRTRNNLKRHSFWRLTWLLLFVCAHKQFTSFLRIAIWSHFNGHTGEVLSIGGLLVDLYSFLINARFGTKERAHTYSVHDWCSSILRTMLICYMATTRLQARSNIKKSIWSFANNSWKWTQLHF